MAELAGRGWSSARGKVRAADVVLQRHGDTRLSPERRFSGVGSGGSWSVGCRTGSGAAGRRLGLAAGQRLHRNPDLADDPVSGGGLPGSSAALAVSIIVDRDLLEMDFGLWEGMTFDEVQDRYPRIFGGGHSRRGLLPPARNLLPQ